MATSVRARLRSSAREPKTVHALRRAVFFDPDLILILMILI